MVPKRDKMFTTEGVELQEDTMADALDTGPETGSHSVY